MPCCDLSDRGAIKACYLVGLVRLPTFFRVETTLTLSILSATDHVMSFSQEKRMGGATTHLHNVFFENVKCLNFEWQVQMLNFSRLAELPAKIVAPSVDLSIFRI